MTIPRVLIVGGAGFLGSALASDLRRHGAEVCVFDSYQQYADPETADHTAATRYRTTLREGCETVRGDARNVLDLLAAFDAAKPTHVVHLAAVTRAALNEHLQTDAISTASMSTAAIMNLAARCRVARVMLVSSSYVYGDFQYQPCDEAHPTEPRTIYGAAKLTSEIICKAFAARVDVPFTIARLIAVYGPWDLNGILCVQNLRKAVRTGELRINAGRTQDAGVDYTHVTDAVKGLRLALTAPECAGQTINISRGRAYTAAEVAAAVTDLGFPVVPVVGSGGGSPRRGALDIGRARDLIGFEPTVDLEDGLRECLAVAVGQAAAEGISQQDQVTTGRPGGRAPAPRPAGEPAAGRRPPRSW